MPSPCILADCGGHSGVHWLPTGFRDGPRTGGKTPQLGHEFDDAVSKMK